MDIDVIAQALKDLYTDIDKSVTDDEWKNSLFDTRQQYVAFKFADEYSQLIYSNETENTHTGMPGRPRLSLNGTPTVMRIKLDATLDAFISMLKVRLKLTSTSAVIRTCIENTYTVLEKGSQEEIPSDLLRGSKDAAYTSIKLDPISLKKLTDIQFLMHLPHRSQAVRYCIYAGFYKQWTAARLTSL